jgi:carbon monoxide dehydrogenase subunit G
MPAYEHTWHIARPIDEVFSFVTEPRNYPRWQPSILELHSRNGSLRVGAQATEVRRFLGREVETTWRCNEPPQRSTIESGDGPVPFRATFQLEPLADGTRFTWTVETHANGAARLAGPLVGAATRRELEANAARLKGILEGRGP